MNAGLTGIYKLMGKNNEPAVETMTNNLNLPLKTLEAAHDFERELNKIATVRQQYVSTNSCFLYEV